MAKRTQTSKTMRTKLRSVNRVNESQGADLKIVRIALIKSKTLIDELMTKVHDLIAILEVQGANEQTKEQSDEQPEPKPDTNGPDS